MSDSLQAQGLQHARPPCPSTFPESTEIHVHLVSDSIQPSYLLLFPSPPTFKLSQHQGLLKWVSSSHQVAKVLKFQLQHQSFQWTPRADLLQDGLFGSPCSRRNIQKSSPTSQFKSINSLALAFFIVQLSHPYMTTWKTIALTNTWKDTQHHSLSEKCKSKPQWGPITCQSGWLLSKSLQAMHAGEAMEKREPSYTVCGNVN